MRGGEESALEVWLFIRPPHVLTKIVYECVSQEKKQENIDWDLRIIRDQVMLNINVTLC